ncbi:hypothetical protein [Sulfurivirga sp.]|uniref:hypothetical protein n=1 Tax=Sulfurivirga sp. TaxID=2614236 RepID=UPI0025CBD1F2|nr:hypothetical protein [Sulfurivirga sp.]
MVRVFLLMMLMVLAVSAHAKRIKIYPANPMLGQSVILSMPADIPFIEKRFNWAALEKCFAVFEADYGSERARFKLYPYRAGSCDIPREKWETWEVPSHFGIRPNPHVTVRWHVPKGEAYAREALVWQADIHLESRSGYAVSMDQPGRGDQRYRFSPEKGGHVSAVGWREKPGRIMLRSPFVTIKNPGGQKWRFPAPPVPVDIWPLPRYLPANITVGQAALQWRDLPHLLAKGEVVPLRLILTGRNLSPDWLPDIRDSLPQVEGLRWLVGEKRLETRWDEDGMVQHLVINQPVMADRYGSLTLPAMTVRLFDPQRRKLVDVETEPHTFWVLPGWLIALLKWGGVLILIGLAAVVVAGLAGFALRLWLNLQRRRLQGAALWQAMLNYHHWSCFWCRRSQVWTPQAWLQAHPELAPSWKNTVEMLNRDLFGKNHPDG